MDPVEAAERQRVVAAARTWLGTPYHHAATLKGVGVDCATLLVACFQEAGLIGALNLPHYSGQWHLHQEEEKYTDFIRQLGAEVERRPPLPGDVVVWKFHKCFAHGAIVVEWPTIIHSMIRIGCMIDDALKNQMLTTVSERVPTQGQPRPMKVFSWWDKLRVAA